jgi:hypothetical protein
LEKVFGGNNIYSYKVVIAIHITVNLYRIGLGQAVGFIKGYLQSIEKILQVISDKLSLKLCDHRTDKNDVENIETDYKTGETDAEYETRLALAECWKLLTTASNSRWNNGYFGAVCWHLEHQQVVIAHRGTRPTKLGSLWTDLFGMVFENHVPQMSC